MKLITCPLNNASIESSMDCSSLFISSDLLVAMNCTSFGSFDSNNLCNWENSIFSSWSPPLPWWVIISSIIVHSPTLILLRCLGILNNENRLFSFLLLGTSISVSLLNDVSVVSWSSFQIFRILSERINKVFNSGNKTWM